MIERVHLLKLKPEHATPRDRRDIVDHALAVLPAVPGVLGVTAGVAVDQEAQKSWDIFLVVRFASVEDIAAYRVHPEHRRFVDEFLTGREARPDLKLGASRYPAADRAAVALVARAHAAPL